MPPSSFLYEFPDIAAAAAAAAGFNGFCRRCCHLGVFKITVAERTPLLLLRASMTWPLVVLLPSHPSQMWNLISKYDDVGWYWSNHNKQQTMSGVTPIPVVAVASKQW